MGYVFGWEWPGWLITIVDATVAWLLWFAYRRGTEKPSLGLVATIAAAIMALARAAWMVFVPVLLVVAIAGSVLRFMRPRPAPVRT